MAREAQTIVANGAQRLSGFILNLPRSAQSRGKIWERGNLQPSDNKLLSKTQQSRQVVSGIICFRCFSALFISYFFSVAQLFGECQSSFVSYIQSWLKWLRCWAEDTDPADLFCISSKYCLDQALRVLHFTPSP